MPEIVTEYRVAFSRPDWDGRQYTSAQHNPIDPDWLVILQKAGMTDVAVEVRRTETTAEWVEMEDPNAVASERS